MVLALATWLAAYLVGAIPFGYLIARARGVNIFAQGSGNIGATNVGRVLGTRFGILVLLFDFAKGALPVALALLIKDRLPPDPVWFTDGWLEVGAGLAAFLGHLFPIYLGFRGGKGVATGAGVVFVLMPVPALGALLTWVLVLLATRCVALASLAAALALCLFQLAQTLPANVALEPRSLFALVAGVLVLVRHRGNIARLRQGTEPRLPEHPALLTIGKTLHVLAMGLWFGSAIFFSLIVALSMFNTFETLGKQPAGQRPAWFPLVEPFTQTDEALDGPREQGSRAAGYAVGPLFGWYFLVQGLCGFIALGTAWHWQAIAGTVHRRRVNILLAALMTVVLGWPLQRMVTELRIPRNQATEAYLREPTAPHRLEMKDARGSFALYHTISLFLNFGTLALVTVAMALTARLPHENEKSPLAVD